MEDKATFGNFIRTKRKEQGLSQKELAGKLYVSESAVSKWERGLSYPDITMISGICEALKITEHELCTASEDHRQRELERTARSYKTFIRVWNISLMTLYAVILVPLFILWVIMKGIIREYLITASCFMCAASLLNIPSLVKKHKGLITFICTFVSVNLTLLQACLYAGSGWRLYLSLLLNLLFVSSAVFLPLFLKYIPESCSLRKHRLNICLAADSLLLILCAGFSEWQKTGELFYTDRFYNVIILVSLAWILYIVVRYVKISVCFRASIYSGVLAVYAALYRLTGKEASDVFFEFTRAVIESRPYFIAAVIFASASAVFFVIGGVLHIRGKKSSSSASAVRYNKKLKITGFILWGILGTAVSVILVTAVFFPGLPAYIAVKLEYSDIRRSPLQWEHSNAEIPDSFIEISAEEMTLRVPSEMKKKDPDSDIMLFWDGDRETETNASSIVLISEAVDESDFDALKTMSFCFDDRTLTEAELKTIFSHVNMKYPESYYEYITGIYSLDMEDFDIHSYDASSDFIKAARIKVSSISDNVIYEGKINGTPAIINFLSDDKDEHFKCAVDLFSGKNYEKHYSLLLASCDMETLYSMIASIEIST